MADIELVIKIPEEDYERCKKKFQMRLNIIAHAIAKGTSLPKGHGDLIDLNDLYDFDRQKVEYAPTIVEADKEEGSEK